MRKQMIIPDDLEQRVREAAKYKHMNFTQYTIRALTEMVEADEILHAQPEITARLNELQDMLQKLTPKD